MAFFALLSFSLLAFNLLHTQSVNAQFGASRPSRYLFVFGDSYSLTGFNYSLSPAPSVGNPLGNPEYPGARLSGGDIWLDVVIENFTRRAVAYDFAVGSNTVNSSRAQPGPFIPGPPTVDFRDQQAQFESLGDEPRWNRFNSLFISWFGINDVAVQVYQSRTFDQIQDILRPDVEDYFGLLERQYQLGARKFITVLVPPIHRAPVFGYGTAMNAPDVQRAIRYWNDHVKREHNNFRRRHPFVDARIVDPSTTFNKILDDPESYGAPNSTCTSFPDGQPCLWHDFIHPGITIQTEFGKQIGKVVRAMNGIFAE